MPRVAVAIPAYNAASTIGSVISQTAAFIKPEDVFVVDDGSTDRTQFVARETGAWVLTHNTRRGKGTSLRDAIRQIIQQSYDWVITLDSDLQHDPAEIPKFLAAADGFDVVIGKRLISRGEMPLHRFFSNLITSRLITLRTGINVEDSQCGYRLFHTDVFRKIDSISKHYDYESDILIKAALAGFSVGFVPIKTIYNGSSSSIRVMDILRFIRVYLKSLFIISDEDRTA